MTGSLLYRSDDLSIPLTDSDWSTGSTVLTDLSEWRDRFADIRELCISPYGEKAAAIVETADDKYSVCVNGVLWDAEFDKIWHLRFGPDGRLSALVSDGGVWTVATEGVPWSNQFEFVWNLQFARQGKDIITAAQNDRSYLAVKNDIPWEKGFYSLSRLSICPATGKTAATVQIIPFREGEIEAFQRGCFSVAVDGHAWDSHFVNAWETGFSADGAHVAAEVRTSLYDYTVAVDDKLWDRTYRSIWRPRFSPRDGSVTAPVRYDNHWHLVKDGGPFWRRRYIQLWNHMYSPDGERIAAIVAPKFGRWTIAVDDRLWRHDFRELVTDAVFSPDGLRVACIGKSDGRWTLAVDDRPWDMAVDMAWPPVFSPDGRSVAAKIEQGGRYTVAINGSLLDEAADMLWGPVFSPDSRKIRIASMTGGKSGGQIIRKIMEI